MLSFLKKIFGAGESPGKSASGRPEPAPEASAPPAAPVDVSLADALLDCSGVDWNEQEQLRFLHRVLPKHTGGRLAALVNKDDFRGNTFCTTADAAVLFAIVSEFEPTRVMEVGSGYSTIVLRTALKEKNLPAELISIDPEPRAEIGEFVDAQLFMAVQDVPLEDFKLMQAGEMVLFDTTHHNEPEGETAYILNEVLPALPGGAIVGFHGIRLPRNYTEEELRQGFAEQDAILEYLRSNPRHEIFYAGGWLREHHGEELRQALSRLLSEPEQLPPTTALWFRLRK